MTVRFIREGGRLTAFISGELDHHEANGLLQRMCDEVDAVLPRDVVLDMKGVNFMDSSGIAVALRMYKKVCRIGGRLIIENILPQPMRIFDAAGIDRVINLHASTKE